MDDTFSYFPSRNEVLKCYQCLNNLFTLLFTMEVKNNNMLPFLDMLVEMGPSSFVTSVYQKPIFTGWYISRDSFTLKSRKMNLIKCLAQRALMICFDTKIEAEL